MKITDMNGHEIEVTNLDQAIEMAGQFRFFHHKNREYTETDRRLKTYWTDVYEKLMQLKSKGEIIHK